MEKVEEKWRAGKERNEKARKREIGKCKGRVGKNLIFEKRGDKYCVRTKI
jgi:hypothetical protein